jgi:uncharacterized protein (TIGR00251 family)
VKLKLTGDSHKNASWLRLRVYPNASRNEITGFTDGILQVKVAAPPVKGKANKELADFLRQALGVSKSSLTIVKGHTSRNKVMAIDGLSQETVEKRLAAKSSYPGGATRQSKG